MIPKKCETCGQIVEENNIHRLIILSIFIGMCVFLVWVGILIDKVYLSGVP